MPADVSCPIPAALGQRADDPAGLLAAFAQVADPRDARGRRHALPVVLALATCAMAAGHTSQDAMAEWIADAPQELLARVGSYWDGLRGRHTGPDERTVRRVFERLDAAELDRAACAFTAAHTPRPVACASGVRPALRAIAVDGKHLNGSGATGFAPVLLLAALEHTTGVVLAQRQIAAKTNEIPEARTLLGDMDITGCVITMDALHTQRETARHLLEHRAHYVFTVKANQPGLLEACHRRITVDGPTSGEHHERERTRGTLRERHLTTANAQGIDFPGAKQIARIVRYTRQGATGPRLTKEVVYVITSLPPELASPGDLAVLVRGHWRIENQNHYVRDVTFGEDDSTISTGELPRIMATLRNLVISMLRLAGKTNIAKALRRNARRPELLNDLLKLT